MTQRWERIFICDRCEREERTDHSCSGPDTDWAKGWRRLSSETPSGVLAWLVCPACFDGFMEWLATSPKDD